jgi:nitrous oxide reductase accessory protein NosL
MKRLVLALLCLAAAGFLAGCTAKTDEDTGIPWSRPANWEGQVPGMGNTPGSGIR